MSQLDCTVFHIITMLFNDFTGISLIRMPKNDGKQNNKPHLRFVNNVPTMDIVGTKQTEDILFSSCCYEHNT